MPPTNDAVPRAVSAALAADSAAPTRESDPVAGESDPAAATVLILRGGADGIEVLMLRRPERGSFAGAWVFPGGMIDPDDAGADEADRARSAAVREVAEETGLVVAAADLVSVSRWNPPRAATPRIRTWFFAVRDPGGEISLSVDEAVASQWLRPRDALERHGRGELSLYPPTWVTLHDLTSRVDVDDVLDAARLAGRRDFDTVARRGERGPILLWHGDAEYASDAASPASVARHRLDISALPWVYDRTD